MLEVHEIAYAAGLFDGEGHIAISYRSGTGHGKSKYPRYQLHVSMSQNNAEVIRWLKDKFGGSARFVVGKRSYDRGHYERWNWQLATAAAATFLEAIEPYLLVKRHEVELALEFQRSMDPKRRTKNGADVIDFRERCYHEIRALRGTKATRETNAA